MTLCTHVAPDSCPDCDGTIAERRWRRGSDRHEVTPPCMLDDAGAGRLNTHALVTT